MALSLFNHDWPFGTHHGMFNDAFDWPFSSGGTPMSISLHVPRHHRQASTGLSQYLADEFRQMQVHIFPPNF